MEGGDVECSSRRLTSGATGLGCRSVKTTKESCAEWSAVVCGSLLGLASFFHGVSSEHRRLLFWISSNRWCTVLTGPGVAAVSNALEFYDSPCQSLFCDNVCRPVFQYKSIRIR